MAESDQAAEVDGIGSPQNRENHISMRSSAASFTVPTPCEAFWHNIHIRYIGPDPADVCPERLIDIEAIADRSLLC